MKSFLFTLLAVCAILLEIRARPQDLDDDDYQTDYTDPTTDSVVFIPQSNQTASQTAPLIVPAFCPQCLYDFNGHRVNNGCSSKPPRCEKGTLVFTSVGDDYEMCCCNYSNIV